MDLIALLIASFTLPALVGAGGLALLGYLAWGWIGAVLGLIVGYAAGVWFAGRFGGVPVSPHAKGWLSIALFIAGLAILAIATR